MNQKRETVVYREFLESLFVAIIIALILRTFVVAAYKIPTGSMIPTLKVGDCIFAWKLPFGVHIPFTKLMLFKSKVPQRGDVVVFKFPEDESVSYVKRVVGIPGDKIEIRQKRVFINDKMATYTPSTPEDQKQIQDLPARELYIVEKETIGDRSHFVTFRRGEDDDSYGPIVVPDGRLFVLGDNRDASDDSRSHWGMVPLENLEGEPVFIWLSLNWDKRFHDTSLPSIRTERLFSLIH
jgi:signal peptidase I